MLYLELFTPHHLALLYDWLTETGELSVHFSFRYNGGEDKYFVRSLRDLKQLILQQTRPEIEIYIFRRLQYPLRGLADDALLEQALQMIPENHWYQMVTLDGFPSRLDYLGCGDSHAQLKKEFNEVRGKNVGIGTDWFDYHEDPRTYAYANEVMFFEVRKNRNYYEGYSQNPQKYESILKEWAE